MASLPEAHTCEWRDEAERLRGELSQLQGENTDLRGNLDKLGQQALSTQAQLDNLQRHVFGKRSEKMPTIAEELGREAPLTSRPAVLAKRRANAAVKADLPERRIQHDVPANKCVCPKCGSTELKPLGAGKSTVVYELIPPRFERQLHVQQTLVCKCGEGVVTAPGAPKVIEGGQYGPGFIAHVVTAKCADSMPLYRLSKGLRRTGVPIARTTLGDLFHGAADVTEPLWKRLLELIAKEQLVLADETPIRVLAEGKTRRSYIWTFRSGRLIGFRYSPTRSGETPADVLGNSKGYLVVDGFTGYNRTTVPDKRIRVGCWAHARRRFFEALGTAPEAQQMLDLILDLYRVEYHARDAGLLGNPEHLQMRKEQSTAVIDNIREWLRVEEPKHPPKGPLGEAIRYAKGQWEALTRFLDDAQLPLDNNASERALRPTALGRKNFLFVGHDEAGANLAGLYSLVATCEENGVNPQEYLTDVLVRVQSHPHSQLDQLLPHLWKPPNAAAASP
jgi:transposase